MGCTYSRPNGRRDPNIPSFKVQNVDCEGVEMNRGRIEIKDGDLVYDKKGYDEIRWPLRWLRRYGYERELFSFESGRRCATGNGIYAFKCCNAEALFNLVRETLERAGHEDQRVQHQQQQQQHRMMNHGTGTRVSNRSTQQTTTGNSVEAQEVFIPSDSEDFYNGSAMHYVNGPLLENADHEYVNTGPPRSISAAFQIDETAALVDFLHNPPSFGRGQSQLNYAEIEAVDAPVSMENLLDEAGVGAIHNVPRRGLADGSNRLSQPSLGSGGGRHESSRFSMPNDLVAAAASQDSDSMLQAGDSDVFLDGTGEGAACSNYVNVAVDDPAITTTTDTTTDTTTVPKPVGPLPPPFSLMCPPTHEMNYANLAFEPPRSTAEVNYITIAHNAQKAEGASAGGPVAGAGNSITTPMSPTNCVSLPDSPSRKMRSYAEIDFGRTQALSNTARSQDDEEGSRKTRHNSDW